MPALMLAAIPSACAVAAGGSFSSFAALAAAPKVPIVPVLRSPLVVQQVASPAVVEAQATPTARPTERPVQAAKKAGLDPSLARQTLELKGREEPIEVVRLRVDAQDVAMRLS